MITLAEQHANDRLQGSLNNLLRGSGQPTVGIFDDSGSPLQRPASADDPEVGVLLCTFTLTPTVGVVDNGQLVVTPPDDALVLVSGDARYARFYDGNGDPSFDADVSLLAGDGEVKLQALDLHAGGAVRLLSAVFG